MSDSLFLPIKAQVEQAVNISENFNMKRLADAVWPLVEVLPEVRAILPILRSQLGNGYGKLIYAILRNAFLIELVKVPKIETTKFRVRWVDQLEGDPRYCSFNECLDIAVDLLLALPTWLQAPAFAECLNLSFSVGIIPYEAPLDYRYRLTSEGRLHQKGNMVWFYDDLILRTLMLRKYLQQPTTNPDLTFLRTVTAKITVKTYLTDRVQTGTYKTNREKRWETHPLSVHFAERRVCMAIEYALITQICAFEGFPLTLLTQLRQANIVPQTLPTALCPITGDPLSYEQFRRELLNPTHGKSDFQVGHLNPLKLGADGEAAGHTADNISWISADGNRIQGSLSLRDVRQLIRRIAQNYDRQGW